MNQGIWDPLVNPMPVAELCGILRDGNAKVKARKREAL